MSESNGNESEAALLRVVYHAAPFPGPDGVLRTPDPIDLGDNLELARRWMRRRLSLYDGPAATRFVNETIDVEAPAPLSEPELAEATAAAAAAVEAYDAEQADSALDELAAGLDADEMYDTDAVSDPLAGFDEFTDDDGR